MFYISITYFLLFDSTENQRPTFPVPATQINSRASEEDLHYFCLGFLEGQDDRSVSLLVRHVPAGTPLLGSESLHTLHISSPDSSMAQSLTTMSLDIVVNVWLLHYDVHSVRVSLN